MLSKIWNNFVSLYFVGLKNPEKFPPKFQAYLPSTKIKKITDELLQERRDFRQFSSRRFFLDMFFGICHGSRFSGLSHRFCPLQALMKMQGMYAHWWTRGLSTDTLLQLRAEQALVVKALHRYISLCLSLSGEVQEGREKQHVTENVMTKITRQPMKIVGPVLGRKDFSRIFILSRQTFFAELSPDFFSSFCVRKSAQTNSLGKSPAKSSKFYITKVPDTFLQTGPGQKFCCKLR